MKSSKTFFLLCLMALTSLFSLSGCKTTPAKSMSDSKEDRWFNPAVFDINTLENGTVYSAEFDAEFATRDGQIATANDCVELDTLSESDIAERDYVRWQFFKVDCEAVERFYRGTEEAINTWQNGFDFSFIELLPATAIPDLGGQLMEGRSGTLASAEPNLTLLNTKEHSVKISMNEMIVDYVLVARGDFNRDGYHDLFIRMDWYIKGSFGDGVDWVVLTRKSSRAIPEILWRK